MQVAADTLCMGCMDPKQGGRCPNPEKCGWQEESESRRFPHLAPRTLLENRYVLGKVLGQGGFGITYLAAELNGYRKLAIKEYFPTSFATRTNDHRTVTYAGPDNREPYQYGLRKFEEEAQTLQRFQSCASIVSVLRSFKAHGTAYIVMEYLDGVTLLAHLKRQPESRLPFGEAVLTLQPVMDALRETHRAGMIHRDVSPDNIYLCRSGAVKLLDFGAARVAFGDQTKSQQLILKPGYTPEEQYRSSGVAGPYTDIYSLGATIYRSITGQPPPEASERWNHDPITPPSQLAVLPSRAEKVLLKALAVRSQDRYQSVDEFQHELIATLPGKKPAPAPNQPANVFTVWWTIGCALLLAGSALQWDGGRWLFWLGLAPALIGIFYLAPFLRAGGARAAVFGLLALAGLVLTAFTPFGAVLLVAAIFAVHGGRGEPHSKAAPPRPRFGLRCIQGELAGNVLELGNSPVVIGRVPDEANVVIPLGQISAAHVRIWVDAAIGALWIEDLNSRNGTWMRRSAPAGDWVRVSGRERLAKGDRFYLCAEELAEFEVEFVS